MSCIKCGFVPCLCMRVCDCARLAVVLNWLSLYIQIYIAACDGGTHRLLFSSIHIFLLNLLWIVLMLLLSSTKTILFSNLMYFIEVQWVSSIKHSYKFSSGTDSFTSRNLLNLSSSLCFICFLSSFIYCLMNWVWVKNHVLFCSFISLSIAAK